ncbi:ATP-binding protein [Adhaeribacter sp. BT258]|uniref:ATP-binding protein n=1 Tax=Adhaeribacter terrigena TaxID=2793070 RepID=A0ABS1BWQ4_9BACT|nr:ATP-binding protein [Adhaeribacter terrigena]MBK0401474.1 ATP-binding protein [Adhaeribacter terrigena]
MKRIAITGPESTGKSTLAQQLAGYFKALWVPEFAREYVANLNQAYTLTDLENIARGQLRLQQQAEAQAHKILFADTELLVLKIWSENAFGTCPAWILDELQNQRFDLYLLMNIDLPWEPDPQREHPHLRQYFFDLYKAELERLNFPFEVISGTDEERFRAALQVIQPSK